MDDRAQGGVDQDAAGGDENISQTESDSSFGTGVDLAPADLSDIKPRPGSFMLFPHVVMTDSGDHLPVCTQTMSITLAMRSCGVRSKIYGVPADNIPQWHAGIKCDEGRSDVPALRKVTDELAKTEQPDWGCVGCGDKFGQPLMRRGGVYYRGIEACFEAFKKSSDDASKDMSKLNYSTPHSDWLLEVRRSKLRRDELNKRI